MAVGYLESHGRAETVAQAEGLEIVPRRELVYRGTPLEEMDLPAVLARKPELCLIDELAHTNAPGVEHEKRYEDVRDVLEAGIDVYSTVNVQHLESLNDQVTQLTGARVRETIPDEVLSEADEVVLIDLTPEALIARLRAGKVYRPERVPAALNNFFKIENLSALRETALRQVAEDVEVKRLVTRGGAARAPRRGGPRRSAGGGAAGDRGAAAGAGDARAATPSGSCAAPGARPSAWTRSWTCSWCARPGRPPSARGPQAPGGAAAADLDARGAAARRGGGGRGRGRDRRRAGAGQHLRADGHALAAARPRPPGRRRERSLLMRLLRGLPGWTCAIVADPTLRARRRSRRPERRLPERASRQDARDAVSRRPARVDRRVRP